MSGGRYSVRHRRVPRWLIDEKGIEPHIPVKEWHGQNHGAFTRRDFTFQPDDNSFTCPGGKRLPFIGVSNLTRINYYKADPSDCAACALKANCTPGRARRIGVHWEEAARQAARSLIDTERFSRSIRERKRIESLFAELKTRFNLRRLRLRRLRNAERAVDTCSHRSEFEAPRQVPECSDASASLNGKPEKRNLVAHRGGGAQHSLSPGYFSTASSIFGRVAGCDQLT